MLSTIIQNEYYNTRLYKMTKIEIICKERMLEALKMSTGNDGYVEAVKR